MVILRKLIRRSRCLLSAALTNSDNTFRLVTITLSHITLLTEYLVEYFVQSWYKGDLSIHDGLFLLIPYPHGLGGLDPTYRSGRSRTCSSWVLRWYICSTDSFLLRGRLTTAAAFVTAGGGEGCSRKCCQIMLHPPRGNSPETPCV